MAYRFVNPAPVFQGLSGATNVPGGSWTFYVRGSTSTLKDVYLDDVGTLAANPVVLGLDSRLPYPVWLDGEYTAELRDADDALITTQDLASEVPAGLNLPILNEGEVLSGDGTNYIAITPLFLPDPTGSNGYEVYTDGAQYLLRPTPPPPVVPEPDVVVTATSARVGKTSDTTKELTLRGSDTAAQTGTVSTQKAVTFATPFSQRPHVQVLATNTQRSGGPMVPELIGAPTITGFTVLFTCAAGDVANAKVTAPIDFDYIAIGNVTVVD